MRSLRLPDGRRIPMSTITSQPLPDPMIGEEPKVGRPEYWLKAIIQKVAVKVVAATKKKKTKEYVPATAQELADEKRHKPLFSGGGIEVNIKKNKKE